MLIYIGCFSNNRSCDTFVDISKINTIDTPYEVYNGVCYKIIIPGQHRIYYKYKSSGGKSLNYNIYDYTNGGGYYRLFYSDTDKSYKEFYASQTNTFICSFMFTNTTFDFYNSVDQHSYYYFYIDKNSWFNSSYGYNLCVKELF